MTLLTVTTQLPREPHWLQWGVLFTVTAEAENLALWAAAPGSCRGTTSMSQPHAR